MRHKVLPLGEVNCLITHTLINVKTDINSGHKILLFLLCGKNLSFSQNMKRNAFFRNIYITLKNLYCFFERNRGLKALPDKPDETPLPSFLKLRTMFADGMDVRSLANRLYNSSMYSGGCTLGAPGCIGGPCPDRLKVRRNCPRRVSSRFCISTSLSCSRRERSTTPPRPSSSPGAVLCLSGELIGLASPEKSPERSRRNERQYMEVVVQPLTPAIVRTTRACISWNHSPMCRKFHAKKGVKLEDPGKKNTKSKPF